MSVLKELYAFRELVIGSEGKILTTGEFALWCALKMYQKESAEPFSVPSFVLEKLTGLSHKGLYKAREKLVEKGFIYYQQDTAVNKPGQYRFLPMVQAPVHMEVHAGIYTQVHTDPSDSHIVYSTVHTGTATSEPAPYKVHTSSGESSNIGEMVHTKVHTEVHTTSPDSGIVHTAVHTKMDTSDSIPQKVHTDPSEEPGSDGVVHTGVHTHVHTDSCTNSANSEEVHTGPHVSTSSSEEIHTAEQSTDFNLLFQVNGPRTRTNTFNKTGKMFKRMISNGSQ